MLKYFINFYRNLKYYIKNISIHGLCTIFRSNYWLEMIFWIIVFVLAVQYFYGLVYINLIQFYNQPVTKMIDTTAYSVSLIPFPAVTICNFNVVYKSNTGPFIKMLIHNGIKEDDAISFLKSLALLRAPESLNTKPYKKIYNILAENGYNNDTEWMESLAQPCSRMFRYCFWAGTEVNCSDIFTRSKADFGFCCSFNSNLNPINRKEYYTSAGPIHGLFLTFNIDTDEYVSPIYNVIGMMVLVHNKETYATSETVFYSVVEPGTQVSMKISPELNEVEPGVKRLPTTARKCWFQDEGTKFINMNYTFENCMQLCKSKAVISMCGCIPYYHTEFGQWRTCTLLDMPCLVTNYNKYTSLHMRLNKQENNQNEDICDCLPSCSGIGFTGAIESIYFKDKGGIILTNDSAVRIYYKSNWCTKYINSLSMTWESFIALVGGFFSLCLGGSIVSACELLYYFIKSLIVKAPLKESEKEDDPPLYWSELRTYQKKFSEVNESVLIFNSDFQNHFIN